MNVLARLGFGGAPLGGLYEAVSDETAHDALATAWDLGIRSFDTAPLYGSGLSERRLGAFLRGRPREAFALSTKVGRSLVSAEAAGEGARGLGTFVDALPEQPVFDFGADAVRRQIEASLVRLGCAYVDVAYVHDPEEYMDEALRDCVPALRHLREEGVVRAIGVGTNVCATAARFVREADLDVVMLAGRLTLLDQRGASEVLPLCADRRVAVTIAGVFNSGILADAEPDERARFDYAPVDAPTLARVRRIAATCARWHVPLRAAAMAFPLRFDGVAQVVVGMRSPAEVRADVSALSQTIPAGLWDELATEGLVIA